MDNNNLYRIWSGKTKYFDEIIDSFECVGIECVVDKKAKTIHIDKKQVEHANGILMDLNEYFQAGW
jgi:hypothetical protein